MSRVTAFLFLATLACVSFEKIQWQLAGTIGLAGILGTLFVLSFVVERLGQPPRGFPQTVAIVLLFGLAFLVVYLAGFYNLETEQAAAQFAKGLARFAITFAFAAAGIAYLARKPLRFYWVAVGVLCAGIAFNALYGIVQLAYAQAGGNLDQAVLGPLLGSARPINFYGAVEGADVYRPNALTNDPNHLGIVLLLPILILTPLYLRLERGHRLRLLLGDPPAVPAAGGARDALAERAARARGRDADPADPVPAPVRLGRRARPARGAWRSCSPGSSRGVLDFFETVVRSRLDTQTGSTATHFDVYGLIGPALHGHWLFGLGLNTFSVYYEAVTGLTNWGPHSFYAALVIETGIVGTALFALFLFWVFRRLRAGHRLGREAGRDARSARGAGSAAGLGADGRDRRRDGRERLLPDDAAVVLLRADDARGRAAGRLRPAARAPVKVVVLSTSYPRHAEDTVGRFVADAVEHVRGAGVDVEVVSPADFRHFGIAYGAGVLGNLRRQPWRAALLPAFLAGYARAARRAARDADLVHAHWLPSGLVAMATRKPFVVQLWGSDVELARRAPSACAADPAAGPRRDRAVDRRWRRRHGGSAPAR